MPAHALSPFAWTDSLVRWKASLGESPKRDWMSHGPGEIATGVPTGFRFGAKPQQRIRAQWESNWLQSTPRENTCFHSLIEKGGTAPLSDAEGRASRWRKLKEEHRYFGRAHAAFRSRECTSGQESRARRPATAARMPDSSQRCNFATGSACALVFGEFNSLGYS